MLSILYLYSNISLSVFFLFRFVQALRETRAAIRIQKIWRGHSTLQWYMKTRLQIIAIQAQIRGVLARRRLRAKIEELKSIVIQKYWR